MSRLDPRLVATGAAALRVCVLVLLGCDEDPAQAMAETSIGAAPAPAEEAVAHLSALSGDVRVQHEGEAGWVSARAGEPLRPGDTVQTMDDGNVMVRFLHGGVSTHLEPGTTMRMPRERLARARLTHLSGRLVARVEPGQGSEGLEVELPPGTLRIDAPEGTSGEVEAQIDVDQSRTAIALRHGHARLTRSRSGEALDIEEARFVALSGEGEVVEEGWAVSDTVLLEPAESALVRTRSFVSFRWVSDPSLDEEVAEITDDQGRTFDARGAAGVATAELPSGTYRWRVRCVRAGERVLGGTERSFVVEIDDTPPEVVLASPRPEQVIAGSELVVAGHTEPGARVDVDGRPVAVDAEGNFHFSRTIPRGLVHVVVRARDELGNVRSISRSVVRR